VNLDTTGRRLGAVVVGLGLALTVLAIEREARLGIHEWGQDHRFYVESARHWLDTGSFYLPHQLAGPYDVRLMVDVLYPPIALALFVPFVFLPWVLWWIVPLGVLAYVVWSLRPAGWAWPFLALAAFWPRSVGDVLWGNTDLWVAAAVAGGIRWGWPAVLVFLKPTFAPLALVGVRDRRFWLGVGVLALVSLPMLPLWADYLTAMRHLRIDPLYSVRSLPLVLVPVVAWLSRGSSSARSVSSRLPMPHPTTT
jgi:hypothetical protein